MNISNIMGENELNEAEYDALMIVPFLPTSLTDLVISDWSGGYNDHIRNSEVSSNN